MDVSRILAKHNANRLRVLEGHAVGKRPGAPFRKMLSAMRPESRGNAALQQAPTAPKLHTVQRGENLSKICKNCLRDQGQSTSSLAVHEAVQAVAKANNLGNANLIHPGQRLDLSAIHVAQAPVAKAVKAPANLPAAPANTPMGGPNSPAPAAAVKAAAPVREGRGTSPWAKILGGHGTITSNFGTRRDPFTGKPAFHKGVDIAAPAGTPIKAYKSGIVSFSGWQRGYGNMVIVRHGDGMETRYAHASRRLVSEGDFVRSGSSIAQVGSTGRSTGNHVHFEVRNSGKAVDPMPYLERERLQVAQVL